MTQLPDDTDRSNWGNTEDEHVGRPNWEAREQDDDDHGGDDHGGDDRNNGDTTMSGDAEHDREPGNSVNENAASTSGQDRPTSEESEKREEGEENETLNPADDSEAAGDQDETAPWEEGQAAEAPGDGTMTETGTTESTQADAAIDAGTDGNTVGATQGETATYEEDGHESSDEAENENTDSPVAQSIDLPADWGASVERAFTRWAGYAQRPVSAEAIKTSLLLPMLSGLGYDVFDLDHLEPTMDTQGAHDGYLVKAEEDEFLVFLEAGRNQQSDNVVMLLADNTVSIGVWMDKDGDQHWQPVIEVMVGDNAAVAPLSHMHRLAFQSDTLFSLAELVHDQQDDIDEAVRDVLAHPGEGFVNDVRNRLAQQGHENPVMLGERVAAAVGRLLNEDSEPSDQSSDASDVDDQGRRPLSAAENRALEIIREICKPEIAVGDIAPRPGTAYTGVLYKDNNRRTIVRLHFMAASVKYIGLFEGNEETKVKIDTPEDIHEYADAIRARLVELDPEAF